MIKKYKRFKINKDVLLGRICERGMSISEFAYEAQISTTQMYNLLDKGICTVRTAGGLAAAARIPYKELGEFFEYEKEC